jgi:hypothetical protein
VNADDVETLRALLAPTDWLDRTSLFARTLRRSAQTPQGLLLFGPADDEPWHMTAHLADESRLAGLPELEPTLVKWSPQPGAPAHLAVGLDRLQAASRRETLLVVSARLAPADLLERVSDVRRRGATIFALDQGDRELDGLAHESLAVPEASAPVSFDGAQHLISAAAGEPDRLRGRQRDQAAGLRARLARLLDSVSGTPAD